MVAADARRKGARISVLSTIETPETPTVELRRMAVKRALANLVGNAAEFGRRVDVTARLARRFIEFTIEDDGPGIPEAERENAFRPFERLDKARNQDKGGGVGLGNKVIAVEVCLADVLDCLSPGGLQLVHFRLGDRS